ncbi:flavin reductase family protein [Streptomyces botrytidirepellens]|uniref:Flavin reductase family protein n=1 Tax=Streptomyces botrytidirepellens TaxID=2486417 RepID=A0A3M8WLB0_9ACTN|nr:flavin reductase family protein [Streptomyces botrytidirepellens]RNG28763.1 flavin reductase family protein [Streptomyces botrytidirepellens]
MIIDTASLDARSSYKLLIGSVLPRAIAWVSTRSTAGVGNVAPVSFFTVVGRIPPTVSISLQPRSDEVTLKDTFVNIRDTGEFVVNMVSLGQVDEAHRSAFEFDSEVDEFEALGLEKAECEVVSAPRIAGAPISMECVVDRIIPMPPLPDHVVWGRVERFHVRDDLYLPGGRIDTGALGAVGRLAAEYSLVNNIFTTPLPEELVEGLLATRSARLDERPTDFSPIDTAEWSPSGSTTTGPK